MCRQKICLIILGVMLIVATPPAQAQAPEPVRPSAGDKCPVCGMFVAKYTDWIAEIVFKDAKTVFFDGAKDLFRYYFKIAKYDPHRDQNLIAAVYVTEYYYLELIDARKAFYVTGSDVYGPMGHELIPFKGLPEAEEFLKDHHGRRIIKFMEVTPALVDSLD